MYPKEFSYCYTSMAAQTMVPKKKKYTFLYSNISYLQAMLLHFNPR